MSDPVARDTEPRRLARFLGRALALLTIVFGLVVLWRVFTTPGFFVALALLVFVCWFTRSNAAQAAAFMLFRRNTRL